MTTLSFEQQQKLSRAYGGRGWPFHLIDDAFHPSGEAKDALLSAYNDGLKWANRRATPIKKQRNKFFALLFSKFWRGL